MKLSVIILCWNDLKVIGDCLQSIYAGTRTIDFEVIVSDNGSRDGTIEFIKQNFPQVRLLENGRNLRFAKGNNVGIQVSTGDYILILNPDTIIHDGALDTLVAYADTHPEAGAFGCQVQNADGSYQESARPLYTIRSEWCTALGTGRLGRISKWLEPGSYVGWKGQTERNVGWLSGCFILFRGPLLKKLGGFDEQFFYYYEDTDLCRRVWQDGYPILFTPRCSITHLGGQSTKNRLTPASLALDSYITFYRYFYKYYGAVGARRARQTVLASLALRRMLYGFKMMFGATDAAKKQQELRRTMFDWNRRLDPVKLVEKGEEPGLAAQPADRVLER